MKRSMLVMILVPLVLGARVARADAPYSLEDCYAAALKQSEVVATQEQLIVQAEENYRQAVGGVLPSVTGTASEFWQAPINNATGNQISPAAQPLVKLSADQPLFRGFREFAGLKETKYLVGAQEFSRKQAATQLYEDVATSFYTVVANEKDLANIALEAGYYDRRIKELKEFRRIGRAREVDVLTVEAAKARLEVQAEQVRGSLAANRDALGFLTGKGPNIALADREAPPGTPTDIANYLTKVDVRPDVLQFKSQAQASDEAISVAKGAHLPSVDLLGDYYFYRTGYLADSNWDVQVLLTVPIFAGGTIQSKVRQAESQNEQASLALSQARRSAETQIRTFYDGYAADVRLIEQYTKSAKLSELSFKAQERDYRLGLVTNLDVLTSLATFQESVRALDRQKFQAKMDFDKLEAAVSIRPSGLSSLTR